MTAATVLIPTHNHGPLLYHSVATALEQTIYDIDVCIIGDGVNAETRDIVVNLMMDKRVRFFDHPKGERTGEIYRHQALAEARGEIVCYLADDDLWLPNHIEMMRSLLSRANFAHAPYFLVDEEGSLRAPITGNLELKYYRDRIIAGTNHIPLSFAAHTLSFYRQLPFGWRTAPQEVPTDLYMWQQILSHPECRPVTARLPTALNFPDPMRKEWSAERRMIELDAWRKRICESSFLVSALESTIRDRAVEEARFEARAFEAESYAAARISRYAPEPIFDAGWDQRLRAVGRYARGAASVVFPRLAKRFGRKRVESGSQSHEAAATPRHAQK